MYLLTMGCLMAHTSLAMTVSLTPEQAVTSEEKACKGSAK